MDGALAASETFRFDRVQMDTLVSIEIVGPAAEDAEKRAERAFGWFEAVERVCTRFNPASEVMRLAVIAGRPVAVSPLLYRAIEFALAVARASDGAFDPTVGLALERQGFDVDYRTGTAIHTAAGGQGSYRDVVLDGASLTVTLMAPLVLDLGAVAKGMAIDLAAEELRPCGSYNIDAGGDVLVRGRAPGGAPWRIGIRHPRREDAVIDIVEVDDMAVCTSGDYERPRPDGEPGHHIVHPGTGRSPDAVVSATVIAPTAMAADALSTAAFVLGPEAGLKLLETQGVEGMVVTGDLTTRETSGFGRFRRWS